MKVKKRKRQYTVAERAEYHSKRIDSPTISKNQRLYSARWLDGYVNSPAKGDLETTKRKFAERKKGTVDFERTLKNGFADLKKMKIEDGINYGAYIAGAEAKLGKGSSNSYGNKKRYL